MRADGLRAGEPAVGRHRAEHEALVGRADRA